MHLVKEILVLGVGFAVGMYAYNKLVASKVIA